MTKVPDRVKMLLAIYFSIAAFLVAIVRQLFDSGLAGKLVVQSGFLTGVGLPELFVVLCAIIGGVYAHYAVRRLKRNRSEPGVLLASSIATALLCMTMIGPILDREYYSQAILCVISGYLGFLISLNTSIRVLEREERYNAKYNAKY